MVVEWVLTICGAAWGLCSYVRELPYPSEAQCYRAMDELYRLQGREAFKYVTCHPRTTQPEARGNGE